MHSNTLIVITGPTGVGKTQAAIGVAQKLGCDIINADSRQIYRNIPIGTAAPTAEEQALVRHHFVQCLDLTESYSAAQFETDVMQLLPSLWQQGCYAVMCGGAQMYVDAVCRGIDPLPDISHEVRATTKQEWAENGLDHMLQVLKRLDPTYYEQVDRKNPKRVVHAVEVCRQAGAPYSQLRTGSVKQRPFNIIKVALNLPRQELFGRINARVDAMMRHGLLDEVRRLMPLRGLNALNTVGYKELMSHLDGDMDLITAVERIKKNTRVYAKKQLTWLKRDPAVTWCRPEDAWPTIERLVHRQDTTDNSRLFANYVTEKE